MNPCNRTVFAFVLASLSAFRCAAEITFEPVGEEVSFQAADGIELHGDLILPERSGPHPIVVGLVGSGAYSYRDAWIEDHWPFWMDVSTQLSQLGIGILLFEKRGVQSTPGDWEKRTLQQRAEDALAAVRFARTLAGVDAKRIGVLGHSQGGWVAQIAAGMAPDEVRFLITFAGPATSVLEQVVDDRVTEYRCDGVGEDKIPRKRERYQGRVKRFPRGHLKTIIDYDPSLDLGRISQPMLAIFAEHDGLVWPDKNIRELRNAFSQSKNDALWIHTVPGANHAFLLGGPCDPLRLHDGPPTFHAAIRERSFLAAAGLVRASVSNSRDSEGSELHILPKRDP